MYAVPAGHTAAVVTHLEMLAEAPQRTEPALSLQLRRVSTPDPDWYLQLFRKVGQPWLWFGRLTMARTELEAILASDAVHVYAVIDARNEEVGLLELDFREPGECALAYFGVVTGLVGSGAGRWLMNRAIRLAWEQGIERFHVHTCTLDHPDALAFYCRSGFVPFAREIEIAPDPRLIGLLPESAAPQVPIIRRPAG
jgi:GNAT superfamily N-acetyltransferase